MSASAATILSVNGSISTLASQAVTDADAPRFLVPRAPDPKPHKGFKKIFQSLFSSTATLSSDEPTTGSPLISSHYVMKRPRDDSMATAASTGHAVRKTLSAIGSRLASPKSLLGRPKPVPPPLSLSPPSSLLRDAGNQIDYCVSMDELTGGMAAAPPTPLFCKKTVEERVEANYADCLKHRGVPPLSLAELLSLVARECTLNITVSDNVSKEECSGRRVYLVPLDEDMAAPCFLSRSQPTRLGRLSRTMRVKSRVVSRNHCTITCDSDLTFYVTDVGSHSGTFVNGLRLSPTGQISSPCVLRSGDILQLGVAHCPSRDEENERELMAVHFLVLIGQPTRTTASMAAPNKRDIGADDSLLSIEKTAKLYKKTMKLLQAEDTCGLYIEFGDLLHDNTFGCALFARRDGPCYVIRFNNYRMAWEAIIGEVSSGAEGRRSALFAECASATHQDLFVVYCCQGSTGAAEKKKKVARINLKDRKRGIVSPITDQRPLTSPKADTVQPRGALVCSRPASPYITINMMAPATSPSSSTAAAVSPRCSPLCSPIAFQESLNHNSVIERPEIPFYVLSDKQIVGMDRNNPEKERLFGENSGRDGRLAAQLAWGKRMVCWRGRLAVCKDDMLVVLALLLQQLLVKF